MTANTIRMTYLVLAVIFLHLTVMPITLCIALFVDTDKNCGKLSVRLFFVPVFVKSIDVKRLGAILRGEELGDGGAKDDRKDRNAKKSGKKPAPISPIVKYLLRFAWETAKRVRVRRLDTDAIIGIGDRRRRRDAEFVLRTAARGDGQRGGQPRRYLARLRYRAYIYGYRRHNFAVFCRYYICGDKSVKIQQEGKQDVCKIHFRPSVANIR